MLLRNRQQLGLNVNKEKMKTLQVIIFMILAGFFMTSCQSDDEQVVTTDSKDQTSVKFELDASAIKYSVSDSKLKFSPSYSKDGFKIYAFRRAVGGTDYIYEKTISLTNMTYSATDKKLSGSDLLTIGTYKFLSVYGVDQSGVLTIPTWTGKVLSDNFAMEYNGSAALKEIFVQDGDVSGLESYDLGLTSDANPTVTATLKRAVSRVDIMFFKGKKEGDTYTELPYTTGNVFGQKTIETLQLRYQDLNSKMDFFGNYMSGTFLNPTLNLSNFTNIITIGNAAASIVGDDDYTKYDNVESADLINGAAHVFGNYVIPNTDDAATAGLTIYIKPVNGEGRTISLTNELPMERNKVTLVKIYVLDGDGPEEPNVFTTNVKFEVEIETVWDGSHEVTGEIN